MEYIVEHATRDLIAGKGVSWLRIVDFSLEEIKAATALSVQNYEEERKKAPLLPPQESGLNLELFTDNGMGVAAYRDETLVGFLCGMSPSLNAFRSTDVSGVFVPMGAVATTQEGRAEILALLYQAVAERWVRAKVISHAVCLYAHDEISQQLFFHYGFGRRCIDAVRLMVPFHCSPAVLGYRYTELSFSQFNTVYLLDQMLNAHLKKSPTFINREGNSLTKFISDCETDAARIFAAYHDDQICAFLRIVDSGETFITPRADSKHINGAYCLQTHRRQGVFSNLLNHAIAILSNEGYTYLGVDYESINPSADQFWKKYFTPYTHSVVRRIDDKILNLK